MVLQRPRGMCVDACMLTAAPSCVGSWKAGQLASSGTGSWFSYTWLRVEQQAK